MRPTNNSKKKIAGRLEPRIIEDVSYHLTVSNVFFIQYLEVPKLSKICVIGCGNWRATNVCSLSVRSEGAMEKTQEEDE
jgi:hypothetical protein